MERILVVAAHPDDELLGQGATVRRLANEGKKLHALILAEGMTSRTPTRQETDPALLESLREDARAAAKIVGYETIDFHGLPDNRMDGGELLDVVKAVSSYIEKYRPDTIFTHHHGDLNIDHRIACEAVLTACRPVSGFVVERIFAFETPSSTEWNYLYREPFTPNVYVDVTDTLEAKIDGMACYKSESTSYPHPRSPEALRALAQYRGSQAGFRAAEAFYLLRACAGADTAL